MSEDAARLKRFQSTWYDEETDPEFEITRPHGTPQFYRQLLDDKFTRSITALGSLTNKTILTVCGGSGMDAEYLARAGATVTHSDLSPGATRRARDRFHRFLTPEGFRSFSPGFQLRIPGAVVADVESLPFLDQSFDLVYVHDGLHHLENPLAGLREMCRVSRWAISLTEPAQAVATRIAVKLGRAEEIEEAGNRVARLDPSEIEAFLNQQGFQVVESKRYFMYYKHHPGWVMRLLSVPVIHQVAWIVYRGSGRILDPLGNKVTIQAVRVTPPSEPNTSPEYEKRNGRA